MEIVKKVLNAVIGYSGSSEDPSKMSTRFTSILVAIIAKILTVAALFGYVIPFTDAQMQVVAATLAFVCACIFWLFGFVKFVINALKKPAV